MIIGAAIETVRVSVQAMNQELVAVKMPPKLILDLAAELLSSANSIAMVEDNTKNLPEGAAGVYHGIPIYINENNSIEFILK